ncbi:hypothetical protein L1987_35414 [Smallanthus sonchifolius]|uniref:Uncharacterized protein n=1 Tax=Smallanthus sonchifolius TaxID=185202 RepID=A0ACB9HX99_9ASTR|nr:hypothetical protein L1987_35414 [Smallanthus sonchifolius]
MLKKGARQSSLLHRVTLVRMPDYHEEEGEDIAEEEVVCRICMVELRKGVDDTLKMECNCIGELALALQECAMRWFSIKGNKPCEVCKQEVKNLPSMAGFTHSCDREHACILLFLVATFG